MNLDSILKNSQVTEQNYDYKKDGLLYCGTCNTPKEFYLAYMDRTVGTLCKCSKEVYGKEESERKQKEERERIGRLRTRGIQDRSFLTWTFENDDGSNPALTDKAMRYCVKWDTMHKDNIGLLLWGNVGTGKTYFAACIANYLINLGAPVLMTSFIKLTNALTGFDEDKNAYIQSLNNYKLLIIDDLGAERQSDYMLEQVYNIIDSRYKNQQPIIITTNLSLPEIKNPSDIKYSRIYSRITEMCVPIKFEGSDKRKESSSIKLEKAKELFE